MSYDDTEDDFESYDDEDYEDDTGGEGDGDGDGDGDGVGDRAEPESLLAPQSAAFGAPVLVPQQQPPHPMPAAAASPPKSRSQSRRGARSSQEELEQNWQGRCVSPPQEYNAVGDPLCHYTKTDSFRKHLTEVGLRARYDSAAESEQMAHQQWVLEQHDKHHPIETLEKDPQPVLDQIYGGKGDLGDAEADALALLAPISRQSPYLDPAENHLSAPSSRQSTAQSRRQIGSKGGKKARKLYIVSLGSGHTLGRVDCCPHDTLSDVRQLLLLKQPQMTNYSFVFSDGVPIHRNQEGKVRARSFLPKVAVVRGAADSVDYAAVQQRCIPQAVELTRDNLRELTKQLVRATAHKKAMAIQMAVRCRQARLRVGSIRKRHLAAVCIQRTGRGHIARKRVYQLRRKRAKAQNHAAVRIQTAARRKSAERRVEQERLREEARRRAALRIQAQGRARMARVRVRALRDSRRSVSTIQRVWRGSRGRRRVNALRLQQLQAERKEAERKRQEKAERERREKLKHDSAVTLQCLTRSRIARRRTNDQRTTRLQEVRMERERVQAAAHKEARRKRPPAEHRRKDFLRSQSQRVLAAFYSERTTRLTGRQVMVTLAVDTATSVSMQVFDPTAMRTWKRRITEREWSALGFSALMSLDSKARGKLGKSLVYHVIHLTDSGQIVLDLSLHDHTLPSGRDNNATSTTTAATGGAGATGMPGNRRQPKHRSASLMVPAAGGRPGMGARAPSALASLVEEEPSGRSGKVKAAPKRVNRGFHRSASAIGPKPIFSQGKRIDNKAMLISVFLGGVDTLRITATEYVPQHVGTVKPRLLRSADWESLGYGSLSELDAADQRALAQKIVEQTTAASPETGLVFQFDPRMGSIPVAHVSRAAQAAADKDIAGSNTPWKQMMRAQSQRVLAAFYSERTTRLTGKQVLITVGVESQNAVLMEAFDATRMRKWSRTVRDSEWAVLEFGPLSELDMPTRRRLGKALVHHIVRATDSGQLVLDLSTHEDVQDLSAAAPINNTMGAGAGGAGAGTHYRSASLLVGGTAAQSAEAARRAAQMALKQLELAGNGSSKRTKAKAIHRGFHSNQSSLAQQCLHATGVRVGGRALAAKVLPGGVNTLVVSLERYLVDSPDTAIPPRTLKPADWAPLGFGSLLELDSGDQRMLAQRLVQQITSASHDDGIVFEFEENQEEQATTTASLGMEHGVLEEENEEDDDNEVSNCGYAGEQTGENKQGTKGGTDSDELLHPGHFAVDDPFSARSRNESAESAAGGSSGSSVYQSGDELMASSQTAQSSNAAKATRDESEDEDEDEDEPTTSTSGADSTDEYDLGSNHQQQEVTSAASLEDSMDDDSYAAALDGPSASGGAT